MSEKAKQNNEVNHVSEILVETLWDQYEGAIARYRQQTDERFNAFLNAIKQANQLKGSYRKSIRGFYKEARNTNQDLVKGLTSNIADRLSNDPSEKSKELQNQWQDVSNKLEEITFTPVKQMFDMMDRIENRIEQNTEEYIKYRQKRRKAWATLTDEYMRYTKAQNINMARRIEGSFRSLAKTGI
ncbi:hypothetical protein [Alkalihalobacillus sp. BA299]|uniref:hypothetical protein n=1 Tax=Alkalihalobacillus sp. BA299 TaxID=2815938 RepID=UPI001ADD4BE2|nr:hypothetical protein [Alkalihalobacillus sp. BA299]